MDLKSLIRKHSQPGPRYTSYPTVPAWSEAKGPADYADRLAMSGDAQRALALYFHIPFCESLCYYCGCNIKITKDHGRGMPYVRTMIRELEKVARTLGAERAVNQIAWGGGTPTFLTVEEVKTLQTETLRLFKLAPEAEVTIEIDPRVTTTAHLEALREVGFNRVSMGVQDFNPQVQQAINRIQGAEITHRMIRDVRAMGYTRTNFDLIYGLPYQTLATFSETVDEVIRIRPDRIALYNYAHIPSLIKHQSILDKLPMPSADERVEIFLMAYEKLLAAGYKAIGMDHFALDTDEISGAADKGDLYRSFQGYTVKKGADLVGIGASAIGEVGDAFFQNTKDLKAYQAAVEAENFATHRGMLLSADDVERKWIIHSVMCNFRLYPDEYGEKFGRPFLPKYSPEWEKMSDFVEDGILRLDERGLVVTELGRLFVRNVAMVYDAYLNQRVGSFSKTV